MAQQQFPRLKALADQSTGSAESQIENEAASDDGPGQFRMVSTGKFVWEWNVPTKPTGRLTCIGDFNLERIEVVNWDGVDKRPAANEVWKIPVADFYGPAMEEVNEVDGANGAEAPVNMEESK